jgi:hypothetical protein
MTAIDPHRPHRIAATSAHRDMQARAFYKTYDPPYFRDLRHIGMASGSGILMSSQATQECILKTIDELLKRQGELEVAMKQPGGARVTDEYELHDVKRKLASIAAGSQVLSHTAQAMRCSLADFSEAHQLAAFRERRA